MWLPAPVWWPQRRIGKDRSRAATIPTAPRKGDGKGHSGLRSPPPQDQTRETAPEILQVTANPRNQGPNPNGARGPQLLTVPQITTGQVQENKGAAATRETESPQGETRNGGKINCHHSSPPRWCGSPSLSGDPKGGQGKIAARLRQSPPPPGGEPGRATVNRGPPHPKTRLEEDGTSKGIEKPPRGKDRDQPQNKLWPAPFPQVVTASRALVSPLDSLLGYRGKGDLKRTPRHLLGEWWRQSGD